MQTKKTDESQIPQVIVEIKDLKKKYTIAGGLFNSGPRTIFAVNHIDLQIRKGETLGLVGESGCGKSTLARMIVRLEKPDSGSVYFKERNIFSYDTSELKKYRRNVQMIFQDPYSSLNPRKSALSIITEPLIIHKIGNKKDHQEFIEELMAKVGLSKEHAGRYPHEFSGGQRQRIGIARALALNPELIIADEPVSALDASIQAQILNLLKDLKKGLGLTYLFISHDLNVIRHVSDRIAVMYMGKIVELAEKRDIYSLPLHPYTRMLLAAVPSCNLQKKSKEISIKGEAGTIAEKGCNFQNRCLYKIEICTEKEPYLSTYNKKTLCACHRTGVI